MRLVYIAETVSDNSCISVVICIYGKFLYSFADETGKYSDYLMDQEGDFVFWTPDINHKVKVLEDSLVITIRWYK